MGSPEGGGISAAAAGVGSGGIRGGIDALNAAVPIGRIIASAAEGPVSLEGLNNMTILAKPISPVGEIKFSTVPELNAADAIFEAQPILTEARLNLAQPKVGPGVIEVPTIKTGIENIQNPFPDFTQFGYEIPTIVRMGLLPKVESKLRVGVLPEVPTYPKMNTNSAQRTQPSQETHTLTQEEVIFEPEEVVQEAKVENYLETQEIEEQQKVRLIHIVDQNGIQRRTSHLVQTFEANFDPKKGKISGSELVKNLLSDNDPAVRGEEINRVDPNKDLSDQTWVATVKRLATMEFNSEAEYRRAVPEVVYKDHPVAVAQSGDVASEESIENTHKHVKGKNHAVVELEKRKKKKIEQRKKVIKTLQVVEIIPAAGETEEEVSSEGTIHDHPDLAQALKAA